MSPDPDLLYAPSHELAALIARRALSSRELVEAVVARAEEVQPKINCFAEPLFDAALAAADEADETVARGAELGPLHGIPLTIKDGIATAGHRLTFGSAARATEVSTVDDLVWERLRAAGAILIGKTTTPEYFHKVVTDSPLFGVTRNPWSLAHTPGGSSGGAAAALAAGVGPLALGSDGGGSLRCPASCTGTLALKPTMGRVPRVQSADTFGNYSALGPMARDARDLATMLSIMSGAARDDAASLRGPPFRCGAAVEDGRPLRVGWIDDPGGYVVDREVQTLTFKALETLRDARIETTSIDGELLHGVFGAYRVIAAVGHAAWARNQSASDRALASESYRRIVAQGGSYSALELTVAQEERTSFFRAVQTAFDSIDVIATPTLTAPPKTVDAEGSVDSDSFAVWAAALYPFNLTGHPALSVPCGFTAAGLPVGLQLVAPWGAEARLLSLAATMEAARPWMAQRPNL